VITDIIVSNFKAHENLELRSLPSITVFVGRNNTGKSSVLHAGALPRYGPSFGAAVPIGDTRQIVRRGASIATVEITFKKPPLTWVGLSQKEGGWSTEFQGSGVSGRDQQKATRSVFYLSAIRQPLPYFGYTQYVREVGPQGEQTWNIIHQLKAMDDPMFSTILDWSKRFGMESL